MGNYPRTSYTPNEDISLSARRVGGIGDSIDNSSIMMPRDYRADDELGNRDGNAIYRSRSGLPSLVGRSGSYEHLRGDKKKMNLGSIPVAVRSGVYSVK